MEGPIGQQALPPDDDGMAVNTRLPEIGEELAGYKIEAIYADAQSKPDVAINEANRLIDQEKIDIINGVYASSHAVPLAAKVEQQKRILWITTAVSTAVFKDKNLHYVFRAQIHSDQYGQACAGFLSDNAKLFALN